MNPQKDNTLTLDGTEVAFTEGETIYEVARRHQTNIPTLCYDPRLEPFGACRLCVVELEGVRNPVASCTTKATSGMAVRTKTDQIEKHRKTLLEMVASENREINVDPLCGYASQELRALVERYGARTGRFMGAQSGESKTEDNNPFILRDYDLCISCYRCVRVCAEQEGDYAISVMNRGFHTQITTEFNGLLKDSACTFCGQCVQTCPTGALADKKALRAADLPDEIEKTRTICPYCGVGCSIDILTKRD
jgi:NADH dehydrogenase/NADH:ubiquinone oxidoreductase subunit G